MTDIKVENKVECFTEKEEKQPILIIFKIPIECGSSKSQRPVVTGTSTVTIRVGPTLRPNFSQNPQANKPISPPMPVRIVSPDATTFNSHAFLSSIYNPRPFNHQHPGSSSTDSFDTEIERASLNIVRGPRDSMSKTGSIKFGKKSKRQHQPSPTLTKPNTSSEPHGLDKNSVPANKSLKVVGEGLTVGEAVSEVVTKKPSMPSPVPKPRTFIPNKKDTSSDSGMLNTMQEQTRITDITEESSELMQINIECELTSRESHSLGERVVGPYQPIPDLVSMTQKDSSVPAVKNIEADPSLKSTFRINKNFKTPPLSSVEIQKNLINSQSFSGMCPEEAVVHNEMPKVSKSVNQLSSTECQSSLAMIKPHSRKNAMKTQYLQHVGKENKLHTELMSKFIESGNSEKILRLRKVKTKEPKSVKELFPDYRYARDNEYVQSKSQAATFSGTVILDTKNHISNGNQVSPRNETQGPSPTVRKKSPLTIPVAVNTHKKTVETVKTEDQPPPLPKKMKARTTMKNVQAFSNRDCLDNRNKNHSLSYHESLRVPWKGPEESNFKRGDDRRKSYTKVVCVVNL